MIFGMFAKDDSQTAQVDQPKDEQPAPEARPEQPTEQTPETPAVAEQQPAKEEPAVEQKPAEQTETPKQEETKPTAKPSSEAYTYTAVAGSSYTAFAREAITSYVADQKLQLTADQALQAEVDLTNSAGAPRLEIGEIVTIAKSDVKAALPVAETGTQSEKKAETKQDQSTDKSKTGSDYGATAAAGDSYTQHARNAVTAYLSANKQTLTPEQRVAAESYIVSAAGEPRLEIGQAVTISKTSVAAAVTQAAALTPAEQAAWHSWAMNVVF